MKKWAIAVIAGIAASITAYGVASDKVRPIYAPFFFLTAAAFVMLIARYLVFFLRWVDKLLKPANPKADPRADNCFI